MSSVKIISTNFNLWLDYECLLQRGHTPPSSCFLFLLKFIVPIYHSLSQMQFSRHLQELDHIRRRCLNAEFIHDFVKLVKLPKISCALAHTQIHPIVSTNLKQDFNQPCCEIRFSLLVLKARTASQALKDKWSSHGTPFKYNSLGFFIFGSLFLATFPRKLTKNVPLLNRYNILNSVTFVALHIKIIGIPDACITCRLSEQPSLRIKYLQKRRPTEQQVVPCSLLTYHSPKYLANF